MPDEIVAPYELSLADLRPEARQAWAAEVACQLKRFEGKEASCAVLAGRLYRDALWPHLTEHFMTVWAPLEGMGILRQKAWLKRAVSAGLPKAA